jgi:glycosyltransferase involved in cell wall biosynthesis
VTEAIVLLRGDGTADDRRRTLEALETHSPDLDVCLCDESSAADDPAFGQAVARGSRVIVVGSRSASGAVDDAFAWSVVQGIPDSDVVLLEVGSTVGPNWLEQLRRAAYADSIVGSSSAIPGELLTLEDRSTERLRRVPADDAGADVALGAPLWGCVYVRRDTLAIATGARRLPAPRENVSPPRIEDVVLVPGLVHVLSRAVVQRAGQPRPDGPAALTPAARRSMAEIEAAVEPLRVTVDLRSCAFPLSGTQVQALNLVEALAPRNDLRVSVLLPTHIHESTRPYLDALPSSLVRHVTGRKIVPFPHVFHRPYQILTENEITDVVTSGTRLVVTHQDMILDRTPAYFASTDRWRNYTATTALTFVAADEVVFFSEHARREAVRDGLVDQAKTSVIPPGTNHVDRERDEVVPAALAGSGAQRRPFAFVIGNAYFHKNRVFALRVAEELRSAYGWDGTIVFAGGRPEDGSSGDDEDEFLRDHDELRRGFVELPRVTDAERRWLYAHAALVLFPSLYEGFGLVPFEAAAAGTPSVYSSRSSVAEFLPPEGALLELGDVVETARRLNDVLEDDHAGAAIVQAIRQAGSELTWSRAADSYIEVYRRSMTRPVGLSLVAGREVIVGAKAQMVSTETERRALLALRRSPAVHLFAEKLFAVALAGRRVVKRLVSSRG